MLLRGFILVALPLLGAQGWLLPKQKNWPVTAIGKVTCDDKAMPYVFLRLMDDDLIFDDKMGSSRTKANGDFAVSGSGRDGRRRQPDPYIRVEYSYSGSYGKMKVVNFFNTVRTEKSSVKLYSRVVNFGIIKLANIHCRAYLQFYEALKDFRKRAPGIQLPYSMLHIRTGAILHGGTPYSTTNVIRIPNKFTTIDLETAKHEFAHTIRQSFDGSFRHFLADVARYNYPRNHYCGKKTNYGFAFNEGWAEYWASSCTRPRYGSRANDYTYEGNVANGLRGLERRCHSSPGKMVQVLRNNKGKIHSFQNLNDQHKALYGCKL